MSKTYKKVKGVRGKDRRAARRAKIERTHESLRVERRDDTPKETKR